MNSALLGLDPPITEDEMGFIHAVQANPDDDAPRLIYADWLKERDIKTLAYNKP